MSKKNVIFFINYRHDLRGGVGQDLYFRLYDFGLNNLMGNAAKMISTRSLKSEAIRTKDRRIELSPFIGFQAIMVVSVK